MISKRDEFQREEIALYKSISIPSEIHGYSLGVEFMRDWFLERCPKNFFKTIYINGKNVMDDFRRFNKEKILTVEKPALAIIPSINTSYNRDTLDLELGGRDVLSRRSCRYKDAFIQDYDNNIFLGIILKQLEMPFTFKIRLNSKAQQLDFANYLKMSHRIGATQKTFLSLDFHIPTEIILAIAENRKFEIKDGKIVDIVGFLKYLNSHSYLPIVYKFRTINGNSEFFVKVDNAYTHISCLDELSLDDGVRTGHLDTNFHIEMNAILKIIVPSFYFLYSKKKLEKTYDDITSSVEALYTYRSIEPPEKNEKGWYQYLSTEWEEPEKYISTIKFEELLAGGSMLDVIKHTISTGISPSIFLDIQLYCENQKVDISIDWETLEIIVNKQMKEETSKITIYIDKAYYNEQLVIVKDSLKSRVQVDKTNPLGN